MKLIIRCNKILSQTASQLPTHSPTLEAIDFKTSLSPFNNSSVGFKVSSLVSYFIKSTNPFSLKGSSSHFFLTSVICITLLHLLNPSELLTGLSKWRRVMQITEVRKKWEDDP